MNQPAMKRECQQSYMDYSTILNRQSIVQEITQLLQSFDKRCSDVHYKKGIYIYGSPGSGKSYFVCQLLKSLDYDVIKYDAGDVRNKSLIDNITSNNISNKNVLDMMHGKTRKIAIVMDEIDGMNNGDKGGINSLIKLIRQKKTQKQRLENMTMNPIICIGNYYMDKKIRELMKVCNVFELKTPTSMQMKQLLHQLIPKEKLQNHLDTLVQYIQGDIRKLNFVEKMFASQQHFSPELLAQIFQTKSFNEDSKRLTATLFNKYIPFEEHNIRMNDNDRTIIALLWHENIVDIISQVPKEKQYLFYMELLSKFCFADYIDRITFQNQIWIFNETSSLIKTFHNNKLLHDTFDQLPTIDHEDIRFTKVLTKYSTEYNNQVFMNNMCLELNMDKKDVVAFFHELQMKHDGKPPEQMVDLDTIFEGYDISKLDVKRMYRFLEKNVKKEVAIEEEYAGD